MQVNFKVSPSDKKFLDNLTKKLGTNSNTATIKYSLTLAKTLIDSANNGQPIFIGDKQVIIPFRKSEV